MSEPQASNLSDLMDDLRDDGVQDSTGAFTLDPREAERKLANFALARPQDYVLKLLQAAVASGADQVKVDVGSSKVEIRWTGRPLERESLPGLMGHLLSSQCSAEVRHLRHLAAGLRGAVGVGPSRLWVESGTGASAFRNSWVEEGWRDEPLPERAETDTVVSLGRTIGSSFSQWTSDVGAFVRGEEHLSEEEKALGIGSGYLPLTLIVNGELLPRRAFGLPRFEGYNILDDQFPGECRPPKYIVAKNPDAYVDGLLDSRHHLIEKEVLDHGGSLPRMGERHSSIRLGDQEKGARCRAWIAVEAGLSPKARLGFVDDGVLISEEEMDLGLPGLVAVLSVEGLGKDLTGFQLVRDSAFDELLRWVKAQGQELVNELLQRLEDIPIRDTVARELGYLSLRPRTES